MMDSKVQFMDKNHEEEIIKVVSVILACGDQLERDLNNFGEIKLFFRELLSAGDRVKNAFMAELKSHEYLFKVLGDFSVKHNPPDGEEGTSTSQTDVKPLESDKETGASTSDLVSPEHFAKLISEIADCLPSVPNRTTYFPDLGTADLRSPKHLAEVICDIGDCLNKALNRATFLPEQSLWHLPSDECLKPASFYVEPVIIQKSKEQTEKYCAEYMKSAHASGTGTSPQLLSNDKNESIKIDQLFSPDSDGNIPKTVILCADPGRGKSSTLAKILLDWVFEKHYSKNFDAVFLLRVERLKCISKEMSLAELLSSNCSLTSDKISKILELTPEKVLILIDGIDDFSYNPDITMPSQKAPVLHCLLRDLLLIESSVVITTSYTAAADLSDLCKSPQRFTEIEGFSEKGVQEFFLKFFQDEQLFRKTYESVKTNETLLTNCSVPLLCWMTCVCLKKHFKDVDQVVKGLNTTTSIYVQFVSSLLEDHDPIMSLCQLADRGLKKQQVLFDEKSANKIGLDPATSVFLNKDYLKGKKKQELFFKFMHLSFQEFFTALYYVLLDEEESWLNVCELFNLMESEVSIQRTFPIFRGRLSNPIFSVVMFLCGLFNETVSRSLHKKGKFTIFYTIKLTERKLKYKLMNMIPSMIHQYGFELIVFRCLYELQDQSLVREVLMRESFMGLSNVSLRSTDCLVLLYCLQFCPHIEDMNLMYCDLTAEKVKILQPSLALCETLSLSVEYLSDIGNLIQIFGGSKILSELKVREDEYSPESPRWSLLISVTHGDVFLSLRSSEKNPPFPTVLKIRLRCEQSQMSNTDWTLLLQRLSRAGRVTVTENSSAPEDHVSLLLSSFYSLGFKSMDLTLVSLNKSWVSGIIDLVQNCTNLQQITVHGLLLEEGADLLKKSLMDPHYAVIIRGRNYSESAEEHLTHSCNEKVNISFKPKLLENLEKLKISDCEASALDLHCQSCVHIADSDQWLEVEPSVCADKRGSEYRISTQAGRFQCSRTRLRWACDEDVTLQYRAVDGRLLIADLESLQCERIAPVFDVNVISGKLEEVHLPHYVCLAEANPALTNNVKLLIKRDEGIFLQPVELSRYHAKILQPSFSLTTLIINWFTKWEAHCNLLIYMRLKDPLILHIYFFPVNDTWSKEKVEQSEKSSILISHPRPNRPFQMKTPHLLQVLDASVHPIEGISFRTDFEPNFFKVRKCQDDDVQMNLIREEDEKSVWTATIWKDELAQLNSRKVQDESQLISENANRFFETHRVALIKRVKNVMSIADKLNEQGVIHDELYSEILLNNLTSEKNMRKICESVHSSGMDAKVKFIEILQEEEPYLYEELKLSGS